jgi:ubiquinone/menaquinone biosynthesis C-methylase UbiE
MNVQQAYNQWSNSYNTVENKTRDLEAKAIQTVLNISTPLDILELGCGTGKNTAWLAPQAKTLTAFDFSADMMALAKQQITAPHVQFIQKDLTTNWELTPESIDLITCSLVLEHIENLSPIFEKAAAVLKSGGRFYIGELHPIKQYLGSKARFETEQGIVALDCHLHHITEYINAAAASKLNCIKMNEWFDEDNKEIPRILSLLFEK